MATREAFLASLGRAAAVPSRAPRRPVLAIGPVPPAVRFAEEGNDVDHFEAALAAVGGSVHRAADPATARTVVLSIIGGSAPVVLGCEPAVAELGLEGSRWPECGLAVTAEAAVTVVGCVALVAVTGSVVVDAAVARGRSISLLPPICIVVAHISQLVVTPADVLRERQVRWPEGVPSQLVFITGPSRSADIEMTLTRGVHGPGELHVVVVGASTDQG